jgi:hypothetical protein
MIGIYGLVEPKTLSHFYGGSKRRRILGNQGFFFFQGLDPDNQCRVEKSTKIVGEKRLSLFYYFGKLVYADFSYQPNE